MVSVSYTRTPTACSQFCKGSRSDGARANPPAKFKPGGRKPTPNASSTPTAPVRRRKATRRASSALPSSDSFLRKPTVVQEGFINCDGTRGRQAMEVYIAMASQPDPLTFPASAGETARKDAPPMSTPTFDVSGKSFLVTGGTQGMGLVIASCIARAGARALTISARSVEKGATACTRLAELYPSCKHFFVVADVATEEGCSTLASEADRRMEGIDGLVNCAAWTGRATLATTTVDVWDRMMNTNVRGPFLLIQAVSQSMRKRGRPGSIVNISSIVAHGGIPKVSTYSVSKAALNALTKMHAYELQEARIRVNAINVGWTLTENEHKLQRVEMGSDNWIEEADQSHPMGRLLRPVDVAATVGHLLSDSSAMMTGTIVDLHPERVNNCWG